MTRIPKFSLMNFFSRILSLLFSVIVLFPATAQALVTGPNALESGKFNVRLGYAAETGVAKPGAGMAYDHSAQVDRLSLNVDYGLSPSDSILSPTLHLEASAFRAAAETAPAGPLYPADSGGWIRLGFSANFFHESDWILGWHASLTQPVDVAGERFVKPRIDSLRAGLRGAWGWTSVLSLEGGAAVGSGLLWGADGQNPALLSNLFLSGRFENGTAPWGFRVGPFFEADLSSRPDRATGTTIQATRLGISLLPWIALSEKWVLDLGYVQKIIGVDSHASKDFLVGLSFTP